MASPPPELAAVEGEVEVEVAVVELVAGADEDGLVEPLTAPLFTAVSASLGVIMPS